MYPVEIDLDLSHHFSNFLDWKSGIYISSKEQEAGIECVEVVDKILVGIKNPAVMYYLRPPGLFILLTVSYRIVRGRKIPENVNLLKAQSAFQGLGRKYKKRLKQY